MLSSSSSVVVVVVVVVVVGGILLLQQQRMMEISNFNIFLGFAVLPCCTYNNNNTHTHTHTHVAFLSVRCSQNLLISHLY